MKTYDRILQSKTYSPPSDWWHISTIDMHTAGEPLRVIIDGLPPLVGNNILDYRNDLKNNHDYIRQRIIFEPRGHADMYACALTPANDESGDFGIIFMHNEGYSTMCGHAIIAISTLAIDMNWVDVVEGENTLAIDAPCGRIQSFVNVKEGIIQDVKFHCVPSFVLALDREIDIPSLGKITYDLAYGGALYAYVDLKKNNLPIDLTPASYQSIINIGMDIKRAVMARDKDIRHPEEGDLSFLYGTIFIGDALSEKHTDRNVCVFAEGEVDRSPTGSGVSGRMAIHNTRKELNIGQKIEVESIIGTTFKASIVREVSYGPHLAVIPQVEGRAYVTGVQHFFLDPLDPINNGFILR